MTTLDACRACDHDQEAHEHYRSGSDCSLCPCRRYRRPSIWAHVIAWARGAS